MFARQAQFFNDKDLEKYIKFFITSILTVFLIGMPFQWFVTVNNKIIQLTVADFFLPLLFLWFMPKKINFNISLNLVNSKLEIPYVLISFIAFSSWFAISSLYQMFITQTNTVVVDDFLNYFINLLVIIGYFFLGIFIVKHDTLAINRILKTLFTWIGIINSFLLFYTLMLRLDALWIFGANQEGIAISFLWNSTEFFLFCVVIVLLQIPFFLKTEIFSRKLHGIIMFLNITTIICSGSRTAIIALTVGFFSFIINNILYKKSTMHQRLIFILLLALLLSVRMIDFNKISSSYYNKMAEFYTVDQILEERFQVATKAVQCWLTKPWVGVGLGGFTQYNSQVSTRAMSLHNTPLWILTETGVIGFLLYFCFVYIARFQVFKNIQNSADNLLAKGMLTVFPALIVASLNMQVFYQRYLWLLLGLVLAKQKISILKRVSSDLKKQLGYPGRDLSA